MLKWLTMKKVNSREVRLQKFKEQIGYQKIKVILRTITLNLKQLGKKN